MARKPRNTKRGINVDFTGVEAGGVVVPEDDYLVEVEDVEQKTSDNSGNDYLALTLKIVDGDHKGKKLYHNCSLQPQALFNLRGVLEALGFEVPNGPMEFDPADMIGQQCGVTVAHETYEGKKKARPIDFFPAEEGAEEGDDSKDSDDDTSGEDDSGDDVTYADVMEAEKEDLLELASDNGIKLTLKQKKSLDLLRAAVAEGLGLSADEDASDSEIKEGSNVTFEDDEGKKQKGKVLSVEDGVATVKVGKEEWEIELEELTLA